MKTFPRRIMNHITGRIPDGLKEYLLFKVAADASPIAVERAEQTFYINYLREDMVVFDVGANIGELTLLFSRFVGPSGKVYSFEASKATFENLSGVMSLSGRKNVEMNHLALCDRNGIIDLHVYPEEYSGWTTLADRPLKSYGIDVKSIKREQVCSSTLDAFCQERGVSQIDLLKIDVEGAEYQVMLGARHMLEQKKVRCCVFEFGATTFDMGNTPTMIEDYLAKMGYRIRNIVLGNPCFPGRESAKSAKFSMHVAEPQ